MDQDTITDLVTSLLGSHILPSSQACLARDLINPLCTLRLGPLLVHARPNSREDVLRLLKYYLRSVFPVGKHAGHFIKSEGRIVNGFTILSGQETGGPLKACSPSSGSDRPPRQLRDNGERASSQPLTRVCIYLEHSFTLEPTHAFTPRSCNALTCTDIGAFESALILTLEKDRVVDIELRIGQGLMAAFLEQHDCEPQTRASPSSLTSFLADLLSPPAIRLALLLAAFWHETRAGRLLSSQLVLFTWASLRFWEEIMNACAGDGSRKGCSEQMATGAWLVWTLGLALYLVFIPLFAAAAFLDFFVLFSRPVRPPGTLPRRSKLHRTDTLDGPMAETVAETVPGPEEFRGRNDSPPPFSGVFMRIDRGCDLTRRLCHRYAMLVRLFLYALAAVPDEWTLNALRAVKRGVTHVIIEDSGMGGRLLTWVWSACSKQHAAWLAHTAADEHEQGTSSSFLTMQGDEASDKATSSPTLSRAASAPACVECLPPLTSPCSPPSPSTPMSPASLTATASADDVMCRRRRISVQNSPTHLSPAKRPSALRKVSFMDQPQWLAERELAHPSRQAQSQSQLCAELQLGLTYSATRLDGDDYSAAASERAGRTATVGEGDGHVSGREDPYGLFISNSLQTTENEVMLGELLGDHHAAETEKVEAERREPSVPEDISFSEQSIAIIADQEREADVPLNKNREGELSFSSVSSSEERDEGERDGHKHDDGDGSVSTAHTSPVCSLRTIPSAFTGKGRGMTNAERYLIDGTAAHGTGQATPSHEAFEGLVEQTSKELAAHVLESSPPSHEAFPSLVNETMDKLAHPACNSHVSEAKASDAVQQDGAHGKVLAPFETAGKGGRSQGSEAVICSVEAHLPESSAAVTLHEKATTLSGCYATGRETEKDAEDELAIALELEGDCEPDGGAVIGTGRQESSSSSSRNAKKKQRRRNKKKMAARGIGAS